MNTHLQPPSAAPISPVSTSLVPANQIIAPDPDNSRLAEDIMQVILPLSTELSGEKDFNKLSERILHEARLLCHADGGTFYIRDLGKDFLNFTILQSVSLNMSFGGTSEQAVALPAIPLHHADGQPNYSSIASYVALTGEAIHIPDVYEAKEFDFSGTKKFDRNNQYRTVSCLTLPLKNYENIVIGVLQLINAQDPQTGNIIPFDPYLIQVVQWLTGQAAIALNNSLLLQHQSTLLKGERDLQIGRKIQGDFLPETLPQPEGWEIAARFHPARDVAGDFYDAFVMGHGRIGIVIADVCDKGVGAALFMSLFRSLLRVLANQNYSLGLLNILTDEQPSARRSTDQKRRSLPGIGTQALKNAMELTNNYIAENHWRTNMFATIFFGVLDPATGKLIYINGGHEAPIICNDQGIKARLKSTGPAVGMLPNAEFRIEEIHLDIGDILLGYTDGVPDARSPERELFKESRLSELVQSAAAPSAVALLDRIEVAVKTHMADADPFDDITMIAVRRIQA